MTGVLGAPPAARAGGPDAVRWLRCEFRSVPLGRGPDPWTVSGRLAGRATGPVAALIGEWAGGGAVLAADPLVVVDAAGFAAWSCQPGIAGRARDVAGDGVPNGSVGGGWFGWIDAAGSTHAAFYDQVLRWRDGCWYAESLVTPGRRAELAARERRLTALLAETGPAHGWSVGPFGGSDRDTHLAAVERTVALIRAGDIYQANVCTRLHARLDGAPADVFAAVGAAVRPRFAAFVSDGRGHALAAMSPELFLRRHGRTVTTSPIKGTRPRSDSNGPAALRGSVKDAAENVMIVDLMRNDLGRVCETGSVAVTDLLSVQAHPGVWHLVSTVTGRLRADVDDSALLGATMPPGSVTGAPKLRALDVIAGVEPEPRGAFTGAVGFAGPLHGLELAVTIRSFEFDGDRVALGVGGGITADSVPMLEWRECLHKSAPLLAAAGSAHAGDAEPDPTPSAEQHAGGVFETVLVVDGTALRLDDHLARLDRSVRELYGDGVNAAVARRARAAAGTCPPGRHALRIHAAPRAGVAGGVALDFSVSIAPAGAPPARSELVVAPRPDGLWRHKWADRDHLARAERAVAGGGTNRAPLFVGADGAVLETSRGNVFLLVDDGALVTPPLRDDLLPGVTRRAVLDLAHDEGRPVHLRAFTVAEMCSAAAFWTSSLSGAVPIASVDGRPVPRRDGAVAEFAAALATGRRWGGDPTVR